MIDRKIEQGSIVLYTKTEACEADGSPAIDAAIVTRVGGDGMTVSLEVFGPDVIYVRHGVKKSTTGGPERTRWHWRASDVRGA